MARDSTSATKQSLPVEKKENKSRRKQSDDGCDLPAKRPRCGGVHVVGSRIYDSEHGKTCHQCRQKTMDFVASCKNQKRDKPCTIKFCHKCLLNRYGEKAEEVEVLEEWNCPKCRGICNCSFCMKKRGHKPTGILVHTAKATGFSSVSELLDVKVHDSSCTDKIVEAEPAVSLPTKLGKENNFSGNSDSNLHPPPMASNPNGRKLKKMKREGLKEMQNSNQDDGVLKETQDGNRGGEVLLHETTRRKRQIAKEGNKDMQEGNQGDGILLEETNNKKPRISKKGLTEIQDSKQDNGIVLKETSPAKHQVSNGVFKKEVKTGGNVQSVLEKQTKLKTRVSEGVSSNVIGYKKSTEQRGSRPCEVTDVIDDQKLDKDIAQPKIDVKSCKAQEDAMKLQNKGIDADIPLPQRSELTIVAGIDLPPEDVGHALQFLEFCAAFEEVLELKKREPEKILKEMTREGRGRRGKYSSAVQFHIQLLSLIQKDLGEESPAITPANGENSWLHALQNCASTSPCELKKLKLDWFDWEAGDYYSLNSSQRLRLLNFLCDEVLCTAQMRTWIDEQNLKIVQMVRETKEKVLGAKQKEKQLKQKMVDEVAKAIMEKNGAPLSISEHEAVVSQIKTEAAQAHAEMLQSQDMVPNDKKIADAVRTEPILLDINGHTYWRLNGYSGDSNVLLQDLGTWDADESGEKWFTFDVGQEKEIQKYISLRKRKSRLWSQKLTDGLSSKY